MGTIIGNNTGSSSVAAAGEYTSFLLISSAINLQPKTEYAVDCTTSFTASLPATAPAGSKIKMTVVMGGYPSAKLQVARNGNLIDGVASDRQLARIGETVTLTFISATVGWLCTDRLFGSDFGVFSAAINSRADITSALAAIQAASSNNRHSLAVLQHGVTAVTNAYIGGVYSPSQNRIYLVPYTQASNATWHYIDCATGNVVSYTHGVTAVANGYYGGVYSPSQNRIYLVPQAQASNATWHYIDCATGNVVSYTHGVTAVANAYSGGVYTPSQNRIYLVPYTQASNATWHYITVTSSAVVPIEIAVHPSFNKL